MRLLLRLVCGGGCDNKGVCISVVAGVAMGTATGGATVGGGGVRRQQRRLQIHNRQSNSTPATIATSMR